MKEHKTHGGNYELKEEDTYNRGSVLFHEILSTTLNSHKIDNEIRRFFAGPSVLADKYWPNIPRPSQLLTETKGTGKY